MRWVFALLAVAACLTVSGCGGDSASVAAKSSSIPQARGTSTCGSKGFLFELHGVTCEVANAMAVLLDGRARHQTLTLSTGNQKASWICRSKSITGPMKCRNGARYFAMERD